ncbi:hypothetical protein [Flavobacterium quisquiliarum]|uniref:Uncharacterized protein n=1 Tax=Flavobacterium quisquiliarum TaxID=1834436 RepID=A0ABV8W1G4_9FLAO|nr:hypothetical protein [Flavobacterium quisquiliarum]
MDVIYYYCYLFYKKILKEDEPHALTVWALGAGEGFFVGSIINIFLIRFFCFKMDKWLMIGISVLFLLINYFYFFKSKRSLRIIKEKPLFFGSSKISKILTIAFFVVIISSMFWGAIYAKYLLQTYCR